MCPFGRANRLYQSVRVHCLLYPGSIISQYLVGGCPCARAQSYYSVCIYILTIRLLVLYWISRRSTCNTWWNTLVWSFVDHHTNILDTVMRMRMSGALYCRAVLCYSLIYIVSTLSASYRNDVNGNGHRDKVCIPGKNEKVVVVERPQHQRIGWERNCHLVGHISSHHITSHYMYVRSITPYCSRRRRVMKLAPALFSVMMNRHTP